jgi:Holliday junction resolvase
MKISYEQLYKRSKKIEQHLIKIGLIPTSSRGRFKEYQEEIRVLSDRWKRRKEENQDEFVDFGGKQVFALKELRELIEILTPLIEVYFSLPENSQKIVKQKIKTILTGTSYIFDEKGNTTARDHQFEFRLAAKLVEAGYNVHFFNNPDIVVVTKNRRYAIECKRITGKSPRVVQANIEGAVEQLIEHKKNYYAGIVALDVSALLDKRTDLLRSTQRELATKKVLDDIQKMLFSDFERYQKLREYSYSYLVALIYNYSGSYVITGDNDVGWIQQTGVYTFDKENPRKAKTFMNDFAKYREFGNL